MRLDECARGTTNLVRTKSMLTAGGNLHQLAIIWFFPSGTPTAKISSITTTVLFSALGCTALVSEDVYCVEQRVLQTNCLLRNEPICHIPRNHLLTERASFPTNFKCSPLGSPTVLQFSLARLYRSGRRTFARAAHAGHTSLDYVDL